MRSLPMLLVVIAACFSGDAVAEVTTDPAAANDASAPAEASMPTEDVQLPEVAQAPESAPGPDATPPAEADESREQTAPTKPLNLGEIERAYNDQVARSTHAFDAEVRSLREARLVQLRTLLDDAMTRKDLDEAVTVRAAITQAERELNLRPTHPEANGPQHVNDAVSLRRHVGGTKWEWGGEGLQFRADGTVRQASWISRGLVTTWEAIDRRTVVLRIVKGRNSNLYAILKFNDDLSAYEAMDFEGGLLKGNRRLED